MKSENLLLGFLAGIAAGALLGILLAPDKGSATRKKITEKGDEYAGELKEEFSEFLDTISQKIDYIKNEKYAESLKEKFNAFLENISEDIKHASDFADPKNAKSE